MINNSILCDGTVRCVSQYLFVLNTNQLWRFMLYSQKICDIHLEIGLFMNVEYIDIWNICLLYGLVYYVTGMTGHGTGARVFEYPKLF